MNTSQQTKTSHNTRRLIPVTTWNQYHDWPSTSGLRHFIFNGHRNGFDRVVKRAGRRVLIDENAFFDWVDGQNSDH